MSYGDNVYYNPEAYGLKKVADIELSAPFYSYDTLAIWQNPETKLFYLGTDSGCSCPTPFESYNGIPDLTGPLSFNDAVAEAISLVAGSYEPGYGASDLADFIREYTQ